MKILEKTVEVIALVGLGLAIAAAGVLVVAMTLELLA